MQNIYVYTKRRARVDGKAQYVELIPKLYAELYSTNIDKDYFIDLKKSEMDDETYKSIESILEHFLNNEYNYINYIQNASDEEKEIIKELNREIVRESFIDKDEMKDAFIEHLFRGHDDMQYGIYFSLIYAKDDHEFMELMDRVDRTTKEDRIIYYTTLDKLTQHVLEIKKQYNFKLPLLYLNSTWAHGQIEDTTILLENSKEDFIKKINETYPDTFNIAELICQIPLSITHFKFLYVSDYKQKYLKYKKKYLELKNKI